jgi:hypothetical protein
MTVWKKISLSLLITATISCAVGFILNKYIGFWEGAVSATLIQFILFYLRPKPENEEVSIYIANLEERVSLMESSCAMSVSCPCGSNTFMAAIFPALDNTFMCEKCNSRFRAEVSVDPVLITEPINLSHAYEVLTATKEQ